MAFTFADLYAGAGLFSYGFKMAGLDPSFAIELSADAAATYRRNVADCVITGSTLTVFDAPKVDVLIAGPPCQGFSTLGRRDPLDARNELCMAIVPWVDQVEPKVVVVENVPPFLRSSQWKQLSQALTERGYSITTWELEAADFGTPQLRKRAFTVASLIGEVTAPVPNQARVACGSAVFEKPIGPGDPMHYWPKPSALAEARIKLIPPNGDKRNIMAVAPDICPASWNKIGCQATDVWGRIDKSEPSNTIRCTFQNPSKGRYLHPTEDRVISLREGARLQGVPDDWIFHGLPYPMARQIGNGVPVPLGTAVAKSVYAALSASELGSSLAA